MGDGWSRALHVCMRCCAFVCMHMFHTALLCVCACVWGGGGGGGGAVALLNKAVLHFSFLDS